MGLFPSSVQAPGVVLLRRYADRVRAGGLHTNEAVNEMWLHLGGQLTRLEVEVLLSGELSDRDVTEAWHDLPSMPTMTKLINASL